MRYRVVFVSLWKFSIVMHSVNCFGWNNQYVIIKNNECLGFIIMIPVLQKKWIIYREIVEGKNQFIKWELKNIAQIALTYMYKL